MSKKPMGQKKTLRQQQERSALNNIFNVFLLGLAAECYLFIVYRGYVAGSVNSLLVWDSILSVIVWVGLALLVVGAAAAVWKRNDARLRRIAIDGACVGFFLAVSSWITRFFDVGLTTLCIAVPVLTVLGLIFFLYQRECFVNTLLLAGSLFSVWVCDRGLDSYWRTPVLVGAIAVVAVLVIAILAAARLQRNDGKFREIRVFSSDCDYRVVYAVCAACALVITAAIVMPTITFYLTWVLVIALFAELAYYTTKLM